jgi:hypothetical protein
MFATKEEIFDIISMLRPYDYTLDDIRDGIQTLAVVDIMSELHKFNITSPTDIDDLLKAAEICYYMELSGMVREIENVFGIVGEESMGGYKKKYNNGMPMFFFAQGSSDPFKALLPNETWRMRGFKYVNSYILAYWNSTDTNGGLRPTPSVLVDSTFHWE